MKRHYLLETAFMRRNGNREVWGGKPRKSVTDERLQFKLEYTDLLRSHNVALAERASGYGPRKHRDRWFDMAAKLPSWLHRGDLRLSEATKAVLFTILHDAKGGNEARVAFGAIAAYAGTSEKTVERAVPILERLGLIEVIRGGWSNQLNRKVVNVYRIVDRRLRSWCRLFFGRATDKFAADPIPTSNPVSTARQEMGWSAPSEAQTRTALEAATALRGSETDPWKLAEELLATRYAFPGWRELSAKHRWNSLLAVLHLALREERSPGEIVSPRGFLRSLLRKDEGQYYPFPSIRKEINARNQ